MRFVVPQLLAAALALCGAASVHAQAAPPIKPGLWQMKMQQDDPAMAAKMREMEAQMKSLPPEARKQIDAMMKQQGISLGAPGSVKMCFSKEQLSEEGWQGLQQRGDCKVDTTRQGNHWKFRASCPPPNPSETEGEAVFLSPERYTVKSSTTTTVGGQAKVMKTSSESTWLGADCGDLKPIQPQKK
jgi:hypothetical protein